MSKTKRMKMYKCLAGNMLFKCRAVVCEKAEAVAKDICSRWDDKYYLCCASCEHFEHHCVNICDDLEVIE